MCGIAGYLTHPHTGPIPDPAVIQGMLSLLDHRGPDAAGYYVDKRVALGNTRLSIIDLATGYQPISDETQRYWIVFNGEIYNYKELRPILEQHGCRFQTQSDTEVLLHAYIVWGTDVFQHLNGDFAFAVYDRVSQQLVLGRDRFGKQPLYYCHTNGVLVFASEIKSLLAHPVVDFSLDAERIARIFALWTPLAGDTPFENIYQIPVGHALTIQNGAPTLCPYYDLTFPEPPLIGDEHDLAAGIRESLRESIRLRSRSDVEVGVYLSGGLDSAIVTRLAMEFSPQTMHSFSVSFEDAAYDEQPYQDELSAYLGTQHTRLTINSTDIATAFPAAVWHAEMPLFRTALVPLLLLSQRVKEQGIKVVLTGEGADEIFLGYNIFKETALRHDWNTISEPDRRQALTGMYPYLGHFNAQNYGPLLNMYGRFTTEKTPGLFSHEMRFHNAKFALRLLDPPGADPLPNLADYIKMQPNFGSFSPMQKAQWLEFKTLLAGYLLSSQGDRMSLAHGVENRCPFLDHHVVEYAAQLPDSVKLKGYTQEKHILKRAFADELPAAIIKRAKQPYRAPDAAVFRDCLPDYMELIRSEAELNKTGLINAAQSARFVDKIMGSSGHAISPRDNQALIQLLSLQLLHRQFIQRRPPVPTVELTNFVKAIDLRHAD